MFNHSRFYRSYQQQAPIAPAVINHFVSLIICHEFNEPAQLSVSRNVVVSLEILIQMINSRV